MTRITLAAAAAVAASLALLSAGCGTGTPAADSDRTGGVAVVDLDRVAKELGRTDQIANYVSQAHNKLTEQLRIVQTNYQETFYEKAEKLGVDTAEVKSQSDLAPEQLQELGSLKKQLDLQFSNDSRTAATKLSDFQKKLVTQFRDEVRPIAANIADQRGLDIVISRNDGFLFAFKDTVDITDEVITQMKATAASTPKPEITLPAKPGTDQTAAAAPSVDASAQPAQPVAPPAAGQQSTAPGQTAQGSAAPGTAN